MNISSQKEMWLQIKAGDSRVFAQVYDMLWEKIYTSVYWHVCDEDVAKDIVQDVFIDVWRKRASLDISDSIEGYLIIMARNRVLNHFRSETRRRQHTGNFGKSLHEESVGSVDHNLAYKETYQLYMEAIATLPGKMQEIYKLNKNEDLSIEEISEKLRLSLQTVKNQLSAANKRVRSILQEKIRVIKGNTPFIVVVFIVLEIILYILL